MARPFWVRTGLKRWAAWRSGWLRPDDSSDFLLLLNPKKQVKRTNHDGLDETILSRRLQPDAAELAGCVAGAAAGLCLRSYHRVGLYVHALGPFLLEVIRKRV